ncbi:thermonuclease family protein [Aminobacter anthyllidis]|uniref:thermonuclease family protein n=1 Tax=Aminobacter anthyllidis TaxID=1035067 RepID=UPI002457959F|nr:thermonuclease family protein [Aminobacter anthyllidis]MDH4986180.1 thermonuclease family protein [Aminobacter anthyllidis]
MRPAAIAVAAAGFGIAALLVTMGGQRLAAIEAPAIDVIDENDIPEVPPPEEGSTSAVEPETPDAEAASRPVAPEEIVPLPLEQGDLVREAPRPPLSELSLALPPKPKMPDDWDGTTLFQPVASAAGLIEAKGFSVAISGVTPVDAGESCTYEGKEWNCGTRARTAFRAFLRSRAVVCDVPPDAERGVIVARCRIGKQDIGEWLAANGWAKAEAGGPYAEAGRKAEADKKGIYGPVPTRIEMTLTPSSTSLPAVEPPPSEPAVEAPAQ